MAVKYKFKKDDPVVVTAGKYKGVESKVVHIFKERGKILLEGVNVVKRHQKPNQVHTEGGIIEKTLPVDISNAMYYCSKCSKGVRLGIKEEKGSKKRFCRSCGTVIK